MMQAPCHGAHSSFKHRISCFKSAMASSMITPRSALAAGTSRQRQAPAMKSRSMQTAYGSQMRPQVRPAQIRPVASVPSTSGSSPVPARPVNVQSYEQDHTAGPNGVARIKVGWLTLGVSARFGVGAGATNSGHARLRPPPPSWRGGT